MNRLLANFLWVLPTAVCLADSSVVVEVEPMAENPLGMPVKVSGVCTTRGASCLAYEETTKRLYVGGDHAVWVLDASVAKSPKLLGVCAGLGAPRQLCVQDGIVYVTARETGVWVVDARDPTHPTVLTRFDTVELATGIDVCYPVLFCGQRNYGVEFIDVTNPAKPEHIKMQKTSESQSVVYRDGILYSGDWGMGELTVIRSEDMVTAGTVCIRKLRGYGDGVDVDGNFIYVSTGHHYLDKSCPKSENYGRGHGLEIYDISADPQNPRYVSRVAFPRFYFIGNDFWTPVGCGKTVFCADTFNGLFAVDVTDPKVPSVIGRITAKTPGNPFKGNDGNFIELTSVSDVDTAPGVVYFAVPRGGLYLSECALARPRQRRRAVAPRNASFRAAYPNASKRFAAWTPKGRDQVRGVAVFGDCVYVACANAGLSILKRGKNDELVEFSRLKASFVGDAKVSDGRLYVAEGKDGVAVYNLDDPMNPKELMRCRDFGVAVNCALWVWAPANGWIVVSNREDGYIYLKIDKDGVLRPMLRNGGCPGWDRYLSDRAIDGKWIAQSTANTGFCWVDISGERPSVIRSKVNRGDVFSGNCAFRGDCLLRFNSSGAINYLAPGQAENADKTPWKVDAVIRDEGRTIRGQPAWDGVNLLALTHRNRKEVSLVDISEEKHPRVLWTEYTCGNPDASCWWRGTLLVPCGYQGLLYSKRPISCLENGM